MSRKKKSIKNFIVALICQTIGLVASFIARYFFVKILSSEYLGLNGLFSNILTILSFAELGIGTAITYSLYEPIKNEDVDKCTMLMNFYKKVYTIIGIIILLVGLSITPFINFFINEKPHIIENIYIIYMLFVINTGISYFFSYKRSYIIADQNRYIASIFRYGCYVLMNIIQTILLYVTKNYYLFLIIQIVFTFLENMMISYYANKLYPFLKNMKNIKLDSKTKKDINKNTRAMVAHKIGGIVVSSTDNILLSKIVNLATVGLYSNYYMITYALNLFFNQLYSSLTPSVGNLCVDSSDDIKYINFKRIDFLTFSLYSFSSIILLCFYNSFIKIWLGSNYLFNECIVTIIVLNFYLTGMRNSVLTFRSATGLFYNDRYKPLFEALINLVTSIVLGIKFGIIGIFIGTVISTLATCFWIEPYILYKHCFKKKSLEYFYNYLFEFIFTVICYFVIRYVLKYLPISNVLDLIIDFFISGIIFVTIYLLFFMKNEYFLYYKNLLLYLLKKKRED